MSARPREIFPALANALDRAGAFRPCLLIDAGQLDANVARVRAEGIRGRLRVVDKSLPSAALLERVAGALGTRAFMSFHAPFVVQTARAFPDCEILIGKPLPTRAADDILTRLGAGAFDPGRQILWLIDTPERARNYAQLAARHGISLRVAAEVDIGMRRGGAAGPETLGGLLAEIEGSNGHLELAGTLGYDAHTRKAGSVFRSPMKSFARANACYRAHLAVLAEAGIDVQDLVINGAGTQTLFWHDEGSPLNDMSVGSAFLKPADFDVPALGDLRPAAWIATPVLKRQRGVRVPHIESITNLAYGARDTVFLYGGRWMASAVWPEGIRTNRFYGQSSNQQMMTVPRTSGVQAGDWAFFRPHQSEAVLLQFGRLCVVEDGDITQRWDIYREDLD